MSFVLGQVVQCVCDAWDQTGTAGEPLPATIPRLNGFYTVAEVIAPTEPYPFEYLVLNEIPRAPDGRRYCWEASNFRTIKVTRAFRVVRAESNWGPSVVVFPIAQRRIEPFADGRRGEAS